MLTLMSEYPKLFVLFLLIGSVLTLSHFGEPRKASNDPAERH